MYMTERQNEDSRMELQPPDAPNYGKYDLSHLTQPSHQNVSGPIQDDEALLLFALIRVMCMRRVLEVGGLFGYSATNFIQAVGPEAGLFNALY
jgi:predicted O-methyltransferase YrrM